MMSAFYTASTSFIAQNYGAGHKKRILKVYGITTLYSFSLGLILGVLLAIFRMPFLSLFTTDPDVLYYGSVRLMIMGLSYSISAFMDNATAAARGIGKSIAPTVIVISGSVILRITWIYTIFAYFKTLPSLYLLYVCSWFVTALAGNLYFFHSYRKLREHNPIKKVHI
ncbi:MAG: MATE family efflux transporter [Lachnospiraceae bacterium]